MSSNAVKSKEFRGSVGELLKVMGSNLDQIQAKKLKFLDFKNKYFRTLFLFHFFTSVFVNMEVVIIPLQVRLWACGRGDVSTPSFCNHLNPISTRWGRLCPPYTGVHTKFCFFMFLIIKRCLNCTYLIKFFKIFIKTPLFLFSAHTESDVM